MKRSRFTEEQIVAILREQEAGFPLHRHRTKEERSPFHRANTGAVPLRSVAR